MRVHINQPAGCMSDAGQSLRHAIDDRSIAGALATGLILNFGLYAVSMPALAAPARRPAAAPAQKRPATVDMSSAYNAYIGRLRAKVLNVWDFPAGKNHVVLTVVVNADGSSGETVLTSSPHSGEAERAANAAFAQAQPLEPLPANSAPSVKIKMNFDSSYDPHGDSNSNLSARLDPIQLPKLQPAPAQSAQPPAAGSGETPAADGNAAPAVGGSAAPAAEGSAAQ